MQNDGTLAEQLGNEVIQHKGKCIDQNLQQCVLKGGGNSYYAK